MKFQLYSDIHAEFGHDFIPKCNADYLLLAGDIHVTRMYDQYAAWLEKLKGWKKIFIIMGNHEAYGSLYHQSVDDMQDLSEETGVVFLDDFPYDLSDDVSIFGGTMRSDLSEPMRAMAAQTRMNDYHKIKWFDGLYYYKINPEKTTEMFYKFRSALRAHLEDFDGKTIVMSHMAPSLLSALDMYKHDSCTPAYYTDMSEFFSDKVPYWAHGHMHNTSDYTVKGTRVLCNPYGYDDGHGASFNAVNPTFKKEGFCFEI